MRSCVFNELLGFVWKYARYWLSSPRFRPLEGWPVFRLGKTERDAVDWCLRGIGSSQSRPHYAWGCGIRAQDWGTAVAGGLVLACIWLGLEGILFFRK